MQCYRNKVDEKDRKSVVNKDRQQQGERERALVADPGRNASALCRRSIAPKLAPTENKDNKSSAEKASRARYHRSRSSNFPFALVCQYELVSLNTHSPSSPGAGSNHLGTQASPASFRAWFLARCLPSRVDLEDSAESMSPSSR